MAKGNMKAIKRRVKSVTSTLQITKAMEMVASSKLRRAKQKAEAIRPYFEGLYSMLSEIAAENIEFGTVFTKKRGEIKNSLHIVIAGDRGLAGGYNSNILKLATGSETVKPKIIAIGRKAIEFYEKRGYEILLKYPNFLENIKVSSCSEIAQTVSDLFSS
ncbi:MAG: F0F1 ATP synthase subunit gamma, partial [Oscillospiraceae bacterium]|nr:F0F1 ATP synthase subunit gamma [Oscillospiraceae bacterium]